MRPLEVAACLGWALAGVFAAPLNARPVPVSAGPVFFQSSGRALLEKLHEEAARGHRPLTYSDARVRMFSLTDNFEWDGTRGVWAAYSEIFVPGRSGRGGDYRENGDLNRDGYVDANGMNAEHVWPQSYFKQRLPMRSDLHHLMPTFIHPNSVRGRLPFGSVEPSGADYANAAGALRGDGVFEPPDSAKGRVARASLYFFTRYYGTNILPRDAVWNYWNSRVALLLEWNRAFPPDAFELGRNGRVEAVQGNRNPFVDDPSLADRVGVEGFLMPESRALYANGKRREFRAVTLPFALQ